MTLKKRGKHWYGENHDDLQVEVLRYSKKNGYAAEHFAVAKCSCGGTTFRLALDDNEGAAIRTCIQCQKEHPIGDSGEYLADAELEECACPCGGESFEISAGVSLYKSSNDVRWIYIGCLCPACGLAAVYGDWKNEFEDYQKLLAMI